MGEWAVTQSDGTGPAVWLGATGSAPWDPPVVQTLALGALIAESQTNSGAFSNTPGRKTIGMAVAASNRLVVEVSGCHSACGNDSGGGMTVLQFNINGDASMFVQSDSGSNGFIDGHAFVGGDTIEIDVPNPNVTCSFSGNASKVPPLVASNGGGGHISIHGASNILAQSHGGNSKLVCHGNNLQARSWIFNSGCGGFNQDLSNGLNVCEITGRQGGGQACHAWASSAGFVQGPYTRGCASQYEYPPEEWLDSAIFEDLGTAPMTDSNIGSYLDDVKNGFENEDYGNQIRGSDMGLMY